MGSFMSGKVLIYGGSGGIGSALAQRLVQAGRAVHLVGRDEERLVPLAEQLNATFTAGDVLDGDTFSRATQQAGEFTALVYAVGSIRLLSLTRLGENEFLEDYRLNALGAALAVQAAVPVLKRGEGDRSVLLFSSVAATQGFAFHASIGMAKAAVNGLVLSLAAELAPRIRVNAIAPSLTRTPLSAPMLARPQSAESIAAMHALPRLGEADDIAASAAFLLSADASWITGQIMGVDGGRSTLRTRG
jgi:NAD(P)-dependent dehydrogenase (short-subunit alcohol dehydrogenase family)